MPHNIIPVQCRECGKITAYIERASDIFPKSPAVTQAKGTTWEILATCPKCANPERVQTNPFEGQGIFELLNILGVKK